MKIFLIEDSPYASERQEMAEHGRCISMHLTCFSISSRISYCLLGGGGRGKGQRIFEDHMVFREGGGGIRKAVFRVVVSG